jgi:4-hydroxy-tetrahydrodipicolinate synthase
LLFADFISTADLHFENEPEILRIQYNHRMSNDLLKGIFAAALTPLDEKGSLQAAGYQEYLGFLMQRGCHGALIMGTTGEGPSLSPSERADLMHLAAQFRQSNPDFRLLAGTGTPSLTETIELTCIAFDLNFDAVVVLPPYYFRNATEDGLFAWFQNLIEAAVPQGRRLLGYHIPSVSGVPLKISLLERLWNAFGDRFAGIKDSSGDAEHARALGRHFGANLTVFTGNDRLLTHALEHNASGCITAMANLTSPDLRRIWDAHLAGDMNQEAQTRLISARTEMEKYGPFPPFLKSLIHNIHGLPRWYVRPPLIELSPTELEGAVPFFDTGQNV